MKTRISAALLAFALLVTASATAASTTTSHGKLASVTYHGSPKTARLVLVVKHKSVAFHVGTKTNCGYSMGQSGDQISCKTLGKAKYAGKPVTVQWKRAKNGVRVASLVSIDLR